MPVYFLDSSALAKRYVQETGTGWVRGITDPAAGNRAAVSAITPVEVTAAVARRQRLGSIQPADASAALSELRTDLRSLLLVTQLTSGMIDSAMRLAERHALRGYDALQLAVALEVSARADTVGLPFVVISSDIELNDAARANGLAVDDPNHHL